MEKLQYISQGCTLAEQEFNIKNALDNGAQWIQVRWKNASQEEMTVLCEKSMKLCSEYNAVCIINDHVKIAKEVNADGVHVGLNDMAVGTARNILGENKIIGGTANTFSDVRQRMAESCDYIGLGPLRFTSTKEQLSPVLGFEGYEKIIRDLREKSMNIPKIFAIGGILLEDTERLRQSGIYGVAVSGLITSRPSLVGAFRTALYQDSMTLQNR